MTDPLQPRRPRPGPGDPGDPLIGPRPDPLIDPRIGPRQPPIPWTPFGPGDTATPDTTGILERAAKLRAELEAAQVELTRMRDGPGPDNTPPVVREVSRADGLWPFLLIRSEAGDVGARPLPPNDIFPINLGERYTPDLFVTVAGLPDEPRIVDRDGFPALDARKVAEAHPGLQYDVWVHVWNLGRTPATGVRVRVFLDPPNRFLGGTQLDLGDRLSATAHRVVKAATFEPGAPGDDAWGMLIAVAECISDVASGDRATGMDRHCAHRRLYISGI